MTPASARALDPGSPHVATREPHEPAPGRRSGTGWVLSTGVVGGLLAGLAMIAWLMFCAEVADDPTPVAGIESSTWTPITAITSFLFGVDAFHGDFHVLSILFGLAAHFFWSVVFGLIGVALIAYTFAGRPGPIGGALFGFGYALVLQVVNVNIVVNWIQDVHTVYDALPSWGWWIAHGFYGATLGVASALLLSLGSPGVTPTGMPAQERA